MKSVQGLALGPQQTRLRAPRLRQRWPLTALASALLLASLGTGQQACAGELSATAGPTLPGAVRSALPAGADVVVAALGASPSAAPARGASDGVDLALAAEQGNGQQFDSVVLRARGLQPALGAYFRHAARFPAGQSMVDITINGLLIGRKEAFFSRTGALCFTAEFLHSVGLLGVALADGAAAPRACPGPSAVSAQTVVALDPAKLGADITTPAQTVAALPAARLTQGGSAGMFNYRASRFGSSMAGTDTSSFSQVDIQAGFNWNDWVVRSNQSYSNQNGLGMWRFANAYAQKTFVEDQQLLQAGLSYTQSPLFGGMPFLGAQWLPESALLAQKKYAITGVAATRARVVVTQNGVVLLSTVVPPGPFKLTDYQAGNRTGDMQVQVIEETGAEQRFSIAAADLLLANGNAISGGLYAVAGMLSNLGAAADTGVRQVPLLSLEKGWQYSPQVAVSAGALVAGKYASVGVAVSGQKDLLGKVSAYAQTLAARDQRDGTSGLLFSSSLAWSNAEHLQVGVSALLRTADYRSAQEAQSLLVPEAGAPTQGMHTQFGASLNWNSPTLGSFNANATRQTPFNAPASNTFALGWGTAVGKGRVNFSLSRTLQIDPLNQFAGNSNNSFYVNYYLPLDRETTLSSNLRQNNYSGNVQSVVHTELTQRVSDTVNYQASVDKDLAETGTGSKSFSINAVPRYSSVALSASSSPGSNSYFVQASGGVIVSSQGVAFAPMPIQDTFAMVKVGDVAGVQLNTPQGSVWSGPNGLTAVPGLTPFGSSALEVVTTSLPHGVDVDQAVQVVQAVRGAVVELAIKANRVQRVLLVVSYKGEALPEKLAVFRNNNEFFTASAQDGAIMVSDFKSDQHYAVQLEDGSTCRLGAIALSELAEDRNFQRGVATCL